MKPIQTPEMGMGMLGPVPAHLLNLKQCGSVVKFRKFGDSKIKFQQNWLDRARENKVGKQLVWQ